MAVIYLSSVDGNNADDGSTWALAKATLAAAMTAAGAGGTVYVDSAHSEAPGSSITLASPGTIASPQKILCVDRTGNPEPPTALATGAIVSAGTGSDLVIIMTGSFYCYGIEFRCGTSGNTGYVHLGGSSEQAVYQAYENCVLFSSTNGGGSNTGLKIGPATNSTFDQLYELINTDLKFNSVTQWITIQSPFRWKGGELQGSAPTTLIEWNTGKQRGLITIDGVDLSLMGSGKSLANVAVSSGGQLRLKNCKLGSSVAITTGAVTSPGGIEVDLVNCDSADSNYRYFAKRYQGEISHETTIVRTGGGSDGTTSLSRKLVSSANSKLQSPLECDLPAFWNEDTGSAITVTAEVVTDNVTLTDTEAWLEVEYLGTSGFPVSSFADDRASDSNAHLGSGTNQTTSSETWTTTGLTTPVKQKFEVTFTPQEKGWIYPKVMLAKPSTTLYADFKVTTS